MNHPAKSRVVNLGLPKTGTTTLAHALRLSGFKTADHRIRPAQTTDADLARAFVGEVVYRGFFQTGDPLAKLAGFDAVSEMSCLHKAQSYWPQTDFAVIDAMRRLHPDLKFVATWRDTWEVSQSMLAWSNLGTDRLPASAIPGLPNGFGDTSKERQTWIEGHYKHLQIIFAGDPNFLILDVADPTAMATLAAHLGADIAWWGRANRNKDRAA